jgi:hypothetical protein
MLPSDDGSIYNRLVRILQDPDHGLAIQNDLRAGLHALPDWMQLVVRELLQKAQGSPEPTKRSSRKAPKSATCDKKSEATPTR